MESQELHARFHQYCNLVHLFLDINLILVSRKLIPEDYLDQTLTPEGISRSCEEMLFGGILFQCPRRTVCQITTAFSVCFCAVELEEKDGFAVLGPYLPDTADRILKQLNVENGGLESLASFGALAPGGKVGPGEILFARLDPVKKMEEINAYNEAKAREKLPALEIEPYTQEKVDFDTFCKSDFRAVKVKDCVNVKKSDKLLQFTLDDGSGTDRQILSGIAKYYKPEDLIGKTLVAITNLPPRKMMGKESNGMLLSAVHTEKGEEKLNLIILDDAIPAGAKLC